VINDLLNYIFVVILHSRPPYRYYNLLK